MTLGLCIFITVVVIDALGLLLDLWLKLRGRRTITSYVWEESGYGVPVLLLQWAGMIGLAIHFWR